MHACRVEAMRIECRRLFPCIETLRYSANFIPLACMAQPEPQPEPEPMEEEDAGEKAQALKEKEAGNAAYKARDFEKALGHYNRAIELHPSDISFLTNRCAFCWPLASYVAGHVEHVLRPHKQQANCPPPPTVSAASALSF